MKRPYMKLFHNILMAGLPILMGLTLGSCQDSEKPFYSGQQYVQFADSVRMLPITAKDSTFQIPVVMSKASNRDRYIAVVTDLDNSNAIEGYHFSVRSHNVLIPAGKLSGNLEISASYQAIESVYDSLRVTFRLLVPEKEISPVYGNSISIGLQKIRPFNIDDYVGDMRITCTFPYSTSAVTTYLVKSEKKDSVTLVLKHPFDDVRDMTVRFHNNPQDPFDQDIDVPEQIAFTDNTFGPVSMSSVEGMPSYYLPEDRAFVLFMEAFLAGMGSFGTYYYVFEWISPDQALAEKNDLDTLY